MVGQNFACEQYLRNSKVSAGDTLCALRGTPRNHHDGDRRNLSPVFALKQLQEVLRRYRELYPRSLRLLPEILDMEKAANNNLSAIAINSLNKDWTWKFLILLGLVGREWMRLDNERPSANVEDRRGQGGLGRPGGSGGFGRGFGFPGSGRRMNIPAGGGRRGFSISTIILLVVAYFAFKLIFGIDLLEVMNGGGVQQPTSPSAPEITIPNAPVGTAPN
jgi:hypothetical protein